MAYDEGLAERIRGVLDERHDVAEKKLPAKDGPGKAAPPKKRRSRR